MATLYSETPVEPAMRSEGVSPSYGSTVHERTEVDSLTFREVVIPAARPVVLRGLARHWPAIRAAEAAGGILNYLRRLDRGAPCAMLEGTPSIRGRFFYNNDLSGFNFTRTRGALAAFFDKLERASVEAAPPALAIQALRTSEALPGFSKENSTPLIDPAVSPRLWIGNHIVVATHHDLVRNLAICVAGTRRFTLFPPEQVENLYPGPFEFTPAGAPVSMVDATHPDLSQFPKFRRAMDAAQQATLLPGDAIYIPYMWWHQVESLDPISVLANYWWNEAPPKHRGLTPTDALLHARLAFAETPIEHRMAWRALFDYVVFQAETPEYLPVDKRGLRGALDKIQRDKIRKKLADLF